MGKLASESRPPASGAIIFYGTTHNPSNLKPGSIEEIPSTGFQAGSLPMATAQTSAPLTVPDAVKQRASQPEVRSRATSTAVLRLIKDAAEVLDTLPYVKIVAGLVRQIITISDVGEESY